VRVADYLHHSFQVYTSKSQKNYYEKIKTNKIKEIQDKSLSQWSKETQIKQWEANTMTYRNKYAGGVIVMIKKEISEYFIENILIPSKKGITLTTTNIYDDTNIYFHFIYGPPQVNKVESFWQKLEQNIKSTTNQKNKHYIIGDLNV
jgi:hypothetical protein